MQQEALKQQGISEDEYLEGELESDIRHEYIDGQVYAMVGASRNHNRITRNVSGKLWLSLQQHKCESFASDMKVKVGSKYFYPDIIVDCGFDESDYTESPLILVEVLSPTTNRIDRTLKRNSYIRISSLQEYVLIEQDYVYVEVSRRSNGWKAEHYFMGDAVILESINVTLPVEEIYYRVENDDVTKYFELKK